MQFVFALRVVDVNAAAEEVEVSSLRIRDGVSDRLSFHRDFANDAEARGGEDGRALVAAVGDVELRAVGPCEA